jgi:hypothetical protein
VSESGIQVRKFALGALALLATGFSFAADKIQIVITETTNTIQNAKARPNFLFEAKVILPDGSHARLNCLSTEKDCAGIEPMSSERSNPNDNGCVTSSDADLITCKHTDLGTYWAKRTGNDLQIQTPQGKLKYHIVGSW